MSYLTRSRARELERAQQEHERTQQEHERVRLQLENLVNVFQFVSVFLAPRDLYNLAFSCVAIMTMIDMRIVVEVAMCNGNTRTRKTIEYLFDLTSVGSIYIPSPLRVLRLVNGKRCEMCNLNHVLHVRAGVGMFICWTCTRQYSYVLAIDTGHRMGRRNRVDIHEILNLPRVAARPIGRTGDFLYQSRYAVWADGDSYTPSGERFGPIVRYGHIRRLMTLSSRAEVDTFINGELDAPPMIRYDSFDALVRTFRWQSYNIVEARRQNQLVLVRARKDEKMIRVVNLIRRIRGHSSLREEIVEEFGYHTHPEFYSPSTSINSVPCVEFHNMFIAEILNEYLVAPSRATSWHQIEQIVLELNSLVGGNGIPYNIL